jgi:transcription elongation factor GreA
LALEIQKAAADKDVRENSPLEAAREQLGQVEARIREIESTLIKAVVIDESGKSKSMTVRRGAAIWVQDVKSGKKFRYTVVDASEANPLESKISDVSPLGKVFLGQQAGQQVAAVTPRGTVDYKILEIV